MTGFIERALDSAWLWLIARICLAVVFVASGLAKLVDFEGGLAEMRAAGLEPAIPFNLLTAATLLGGSAAILADRLVWLGAGALAVFLAATILVVHTFWSKTGPEAQLALFFALEHVSVAGGLIAVAIASDQRRRLRWRG
ncbi:DoxX family protein [Tistrella mobilis]|uniref:DoxX family protein n=1 Tax=Tistrella mobilis TaxID=171437 RepID=UPI0035561B30